MSAPSFFFWFGMLSSACLVCSVAAQLSATAPGPNDTFSAGSVCPIKWTPDSSGSWTNVSISLMSGSNTAMTLVTPVISGLDGTNASQTDYNWTCPEVDPHSDIYFYQFSNGAEQTNSTWTSRFAITSSSGNTTSPENAKQPNGDNIPWGTGHLAANSSSASNATQTTDSVTPEDSANTGDAAGTTTSAPDATESADKDMKAENRSSRSESRHSKHMHSSTADDATSTDPTLSLPPLDAQTAAAIPQTSSATSTNYKLKSGSTWLFVIAVLFMQQ